MMVNELKIEQVAERAYRAYSRSTNNKNFRGEEMPEWSELPPKIREAWVAAMREVVFSEVA